MPYPPGPSNPLRCCRADEMCSAADDTGPMLIPRLLARRHLQTAGDSSSAHVVDSSSSSSSAIRDQLQASKDTAAILRHAAPVAGVQPMCPPAAPVAGVQPQHAGNVSSDTVRLLPRMAPVAGAHALRQAAPVAGISLCAPKTCPRTQYRRYNTLLQ